MILSAKQRLFASLAARLFLEVHLRGYAMSKFTGYRDPAWGVGHPQSLHGIGLAVDIDLWKRDDQLGWRYCTDTEDHRELGEWWEKQHDLCRWGGRFTKPDGNHYSLSHNGMA